MNAADFDRSTPPVCLRAGTGRRRHHSRPVLPGVLWCAACIYSAQILGCQSTTHRAQRLQAEQNLNRLRSRVKFQLATQSLEQGRIDDAAEMLQQAIQLDPKQPGYHRSLARCYLEQGQLGAAATETDKADDLHDTSADLAYIRGLIAQRRGHDDEALKQYTLAQQRDANNVDYLIATAEALVALDRAAEAKVMLDERVDDFDRDPRLLLLRARICLLLNDTSQAVADFTDAGDRIHDSVWDVEQYGLALVKLGRYTDAIAVLQPLVGEGVDQSGSLPSAGDGDSDGPGPSPGVVRALALSYTRTGNFRATQTLLQRHLDDHPGDAKAWALLAETALKLGDWQNARRCVKNGLAIAPKLPQWQLIEAYLAWHGGDLKTADSVLASVLEAHPKNPQALCLLGEVSRRRHEIAAATVYFETALDLDPDCDWARDRLENLSTPAPKPAQ